jgi:hypothetical protein
MANLNPTFGDDQKIFEALNKAKAKIAQPKTHGWGNVDPGPPKYDLPAHLKPNVAKNLTPLGTEKVIKTNVRAPRNLAPLGNEKVIKPNQPYRGPSNAPVTRIGLGNQPVIKPPSKALVPTGQGSIPPVTEGFRVKDGFFRQPTNATGSASTGGPNFTTAPNYEGTIPPNRSLAPTQAKVSSGPTIDPYTGESIKPAFQDARNFAKGVGRNVGDFAKGMGNQVKSALKGSFTDPTFLYGIADSANQTALEQNINKGNIGLKDVPRMMLSGASRFPGMIAEGVVDDRFVPLQEGDELRSGARVGSNPPDIDFSNPTVNVGDERKLTPLGRDNESIASVKNGDISSNKTYNSGNMNESEADSLINSFRTMPDNIDPTITSINQTMQNGVPSYKANIAPGQSTTVINNGKLSPLNTVTGNKFIQSQPAQRSSSSGPDASNGYKVTLSDLYNSGQNDGGGTSRNGGDVIIHRGADTSVQNIGGRVGEHYGRNPFIMNSYESAPRIYQPSGNSSDPAMERVKVDASNYAYMAWMAKQKLRQGDYQGAEQLGLEMSKLSAKMKADQMQHDLAAQRNDRDYELDQKRLGLDEQKTKALLSPKPVSARYNMASDGTLYQAEGEGAADFNSRIPARNNSNNQQAWIDFYDESTTPEQKTKIAKYLKDNDPRGWLEFQSKQY